MNGTQILIHTGLKSVLSTKGHICLQVHGGAAGAGGVAGYRKHSHQEAMRRLILFSLSVFCAPVVQLQAAKPNILLILADDLGYGDVQCYNPKHGKIPTPHIDRLAQEGIRFTDAHTSSGVCSPTRYALLTGRYHWRTRLQSGIVGYLEGALIAPERLTIADFLQQQGYRTGMVGKWHLGWNWPIPPEQRDLFAPELRNVPQVTDAHRRAWEALYRQPIQGGPLACGFQEYFGVDVPNWPPYSFIEGDRVTKMPDAFLPASDLASRRAGIQGPALSDWSLEAVLPALAARACRFIEESATGTEPFFLYLPLTSPHTPITPSAEWQGKSGINKYADYVMQTDAVVGQVLAALEKSGRTENTLLVFTSDNGCSPVAAIPELRAKGHFPSGPLRGIKGDAWEGGHRVPFIVRWPGVAKAGRPCKLLVQQTDLFATFAGILGVPLPAGAGEDSVSLLPILRGGRDPAREHGVSYSSNGLPALRQGTWKIIFGRGSGGHSKAAADPAPGQLYDLATDLGETKNLWNDHPEIVAELTAAMQRIVEAHPNDVPVEWRKSLDATKRPAAARKKK